MKKNFTKFKIVLAIPQKEYIIGSMETPITKQLNERIEKHKAMLFKQAMAVRQMMSKPVNIFPMEFDRK